MDPSREIYTPDPHKSFIVNYAPIFAKLDTLEKDLIIQKSRVMEYKKGDSIYKQHDAPDAFYCVISGRVRVFTRYGAREETLEYLNSGKYFGIISMLTGDTHSVNAEAANDSKILKITKDDFHFMLNKIPQLAIDLSKSLSRRLRKKDIREKKIFESSIISVFNTSAGLNCLAYAQNLSLSLKKETNKKVFLINIGKDADENGDILKLKHPFPTPDAINCLTLKCRELDVNILNVYHDNASADYSANLNALLTHLTGDYHYVIVNFSSPKDDMVFSALRQSDIIHILTDYNTDNLSGARDLINDLVRSLNYPQEKVKVIASVGNDPKDPSFDKAVEFLNYKIYATLPALDKEKVGDTKRIVLDEPKCEYAMTIRRIAREVGDVHVGLALSGGAAYGLAHIGVLKVLERENIPIDFIAGSSIGALIGALWVCGFNADDIEKITADFDKNKKKVLRLIADPCFPKLAFFKGNRIRAFLEKHIGDKTFKDVRCPFRVVACNLSRRQEFIFDSGKIVDAVMASIAIPGVFKPVKVGSEVLVDGGIIESVPIGILVRSGIRRIIAVNVLPSAENIAQQFNYDQGRIDEEKRKAWAKGPLNGIKYNLGAYFKSLVYPNILDIIVNSIQTLEYIISKSDAQKADIVISPEISGVEWFGFFEVKSLIKQGEEEAQKSLEAIKTLINE